jgi:hypothetical protein
MTLVAVDHGCCQTSQSGQRLVAFQAGVEYIVSMISIYLIESVLC